MAVVETRFGVTPTNHSAALLFESEPLIEPLLVPVLPATLPPLQPPKASAAVPPWPNVVSPVMMSTTVRAVKVSILRAHPRRLNGTGVLPSTAVMLMIGVGGHRTPSCAAAP